MASASLRDSLGWLDAADGSDVRATEVIKCVYVICRWLVTTKGIGVEGKRREKMYTFEFYNINIALDEIKMKLSITRRRTLGYRPSRRLSQRARKL